MRSLGQIVEGSIAQVVAFDHLLFPVCHRSGIKIHAATDFPTASSSVVVVIAANSSVGSLH